MANNSHSTTTNTNKKSWAQTPAGKRRLSQLAKARWAQRRAAVAKGGSAGITTDGDTNLVTMVNTYVALGNKIIEAIVRGKAA